MAVAAVSHHSAPRSERPGKNEALRGQKTATEGGQRPGVLKEPEPQLVDVVLSGRAASVPLLGPPSLAPTPEDDFIALDVLEEVKREEEETEKIDAMVRSLFSSLASSSSVGKRKKKKKKTKLPRGGTHSARAVRTGTSGHYSTGSSFLAGSCSVCGCCLTSTRVGYFWEVICGTSPYTVQFMRQSPVLLVAT